MKTMKTTSAITMAAIATTNATFTEVVRACEIRLKIAFGISAIMPAKMISEIPLPMPRAVICSPIHISSIVPPVSVTTPVRMKNQDEMPSMRTAARPPAIAKDWTSANPSVR